MKYLAIALGGAAGSVLRYWLSNLVQSRSSTGFPLGTLTVNALGSLLIGVALVMLLHRFQNSELVRMFVIVGLLGGFTTFSTFSIETVNLISNGYWFGAMLNIITSVVICVIFAFIGVELGRILSGSN